MSEERPETRSGEAMGQRGVSRRDFLRRASREAVQTGAKIVPGAAIARVVLGTGDVPVSAPPGPPASEDAREADSSATPATTPAPAAGRPPIWKAMASWRQKRMGEGGKS